MMVAGAALATGILDVQAGGQRTPRTPACGVVHVSEVVLDGPLNCSGTHGIVVGASGITVDLNGFSIDGDDTPGTYGVFNLGFDRDAPIATKEAGMGEQSQVTTMASKAGSAIESTLTGG